MPQLIGVALVGAALWFGYRAFKRQMQRVGEELRKAEAKRDPKDMPALEKGKDGVYRPKQNSEG